MSEKGEKKKGIIQPGESPFGRYVNLFGQRIPRYAIKQIGRGTFRTQNRPLSDPLIRAHLEGKLYVAVLGKWYPGYAIFDIDSRSEAEAEEIRASAGLDKSNSMMYSSESKDSHHIIWIPEYHGKPPTLNLLGDVLKNFVRMKGIEIYPQRGRPIRLPFGPHQSLRDIEYMGLHSWKQKLYWYEKLNPLDLSSVSHQQLILDFEPGPGRLELPINIFQEAEVLMNEGLQQPSSRHHSQWLILNYLFRQNVPRDTAAAFVWRWINERHNGFSKDFLYSPEHVKLDIKSLADHIWSKYHVGQVYPDSTHNIHHGYITEPDILDIIEVAKGSRPRMSFFFQILKFAYPRQHRKFIPFHTDRLIKWSSDRTYLKYLDELGEKGIIKRGSSYLSEGHPGLRAFAKEIKLNWRFRDSSEAVLIEGRAIETFDSAVRLIFKGRPDGFRQLLIKEGVEQSTASKMISSIWRED
ncbi:hypothetical protein ES703_59735 [subsurface metagenome]